MNQNKELFGESKGSEINIREVVYKYIKNWKWFVLCVLISISLGYVYIQSQIPQYKVQIDILIKDNKNGASGEKDLLQQLDLNSSGKIIDNEIQILKSNTLMEKVVSSLGLQTSYSIKNHITRKVLYKNAGFKVEVLRDNAYTYSKEWLITVDDSSHAVFDGKIVPLNRPVQTDAGLILITLSNFKAPSRLISVEFGTVSKIAQSYLNTMKIDPATKEATVLNISIEDADVERGKEVLNKLVDEYNQAAVDDKNITTANQLAFLKDRTNAIAIELGTVEKNVQDYKSTNGITDISSESTAFLKTVQDNDDELNKLKIQQNTLGNLERYLKSSSNNDNELPAMFGVQDPTVLALVSDLGQAQIRKQSLLRTIPETNPIISSINDQIKALRQTISTTVVNLKTGLSITEQQLKGQGNQYTAKIKNVPSKERGLIDVMREQQIKNNLFTYLLQKREETALSLAATVADSRTINKARGSNLPIKPVKTTLYLVFILFGLFIPTSVIALNETLNTKVRSRNDIERYTDATIIADISQSVDGDPLVVVSKPRSIIAEQVRALRSNLQYITPDINQKVILFTSSISGEGKSFVSLNLGASLATTNKKVIILELDLRKPKLNAVLGMDNKIGISSFLIGKADYRDIIKPVAEQENYFIITSGPNPPNPAELLLNSRMQTLIDDLKKEYDFIILDAPPVGLVTDAQILSKFADTTFYVVRYNYTVKGQIKAINDLYQRKMFNNLNIIFNAVDFAAVNYGYGYGYGYGSGYYSNEQPEKRSLLNKWFKKKQK